jgi:RimJ/RimL family protein N-acetyltransferase
MIAPISPTLHGLRLRPVEQNDASFIIAQRRHPRAVPFLGDTSPDVAVQAHWIAAQRARADDAYWICENTAGTPLGTIGIYDVQATAGEWGRFVVRPGSKAAPGCLLLALTAAFGSMQLRDVVCTTVATNARAIHFYERAGLIRDPHYLDEVVLGGVPVTRVAHHVTTASWPQVQANLWAAAAAKAAEVALET